LHLTNSHISPILGSFSLASTPPAKTLQPTALLLLLLPLKFLLLLTTSAAASASADTLTIMSMPAYC
jgi:hypothetical protein